MSGWQTEPILESHLLVLLLVLGLVGLLLVRPDFSQVGPRRRWALTGLRIGVIVFIWLLLLRPTYVTTTTEPQTSTVVILLDSSQSMQLPAEAIGVETGTTAGVTRWRALGEVVDRVKPLLSDDRRPEHLDVKVYAFDEQARQVGVRGPGGEVDFQPLEKLLNDPPEGEQTAIQAALTKVIQDHGGGSHLAAVVLMSDGVEQVLRARVTASPAKLLASRNVPLFTVPFGKPGRTRDVEVAAARDQYFAHVQNDVEVSAQVKIDGFTSDIPVDLLLVEGGKERKIGERTVPGSSEPQQARVSFTWRAERSGDFELKIRAKPQEGEQSYDNNELPVYVTVSPEGFRVLYLEGELRAEQKFLRRAVAAADEITVDFQWIDKRRRNRPGGWPVDLDRELRLGEFAEEESGDKESDSVDREPYRVIILGDVPAAALGEKNLNAIAQMVERGVGLIMIGGYHTFGPGGYARAPLARLLPFSMEGAELQPYGAEPLAGYHLDGEVQMVPGEAVERFPFMRLASDPAENRRLWGELPPLAGANRFDRLAGDRIVLAKAEGSEAPLLVTRPTGDEAGRVVAFAGDSTWRWRLAGFKQEHQKFWQQLVLFAASLENPKDRLSVRVPRRVRPGATLEYVVQLRARGADPGENARFTIKIIAAGEQQVDAEQRNYEVNRDMTGQFVAPRETGNYTFSVTAQRPAGEPVTKEVDFTVFRRSAETAVTAPDADNLRALAAETRDVRDPEGNRRGGRLVPPEEVDDVLSELLSEPPRLGSPEPSRWRLGDRWWEALLLLLGIVGLLSGEWFLRKRWQMV